MRNKLKILLLFVFLLSVNKEINAVARRPKAKAKSVLEMLRVSPEFTFGFPYGWLMPEQKRNNGSAIKFAVAPNIKAGVLVNYNFPIGENLEIGPEIGLLYGFKHKIEEKQWGIQFEEKNIQIPIYLRISQPSTDETTFGSTFLLGYEFGINFGSQFDYYSNNNNVDNQIIESLQQSMNADDLKSKISDFSNFSGSIVVGELIEFPLGIYCGGKLKIPVAFFSLISDSSSLKTPDLNAKTFEGFRLLAGNSVEFSLGMNILKLFGK